MQKLLTFFFSKNISTYAIFNDKNFYVTLNNDIVSSEQLGPEHINKQRLSRQNCCSSHLACYEQIQQMIN